jgi:hypothetical protein
LFVLFFFFKKKTKKKQTKMDYRHFKDSPSLLRGRVHDTVSLDCFTKEVSQGSFVSVDIELSTTAEWSGDGLDALAKVLQQKGIKTLAVGTRILDDATLALAYNSLSENTQTLVLIFFDLPHHLSCDGMRYLQLLGETKLRTLAIKKTSGYCLNPCFFQFLSMPESTIETLDLTDSVFDVFAFLQCSEVRKSSALKKLVLSGKGICYGGLGALAQLEECSDVVSLDIGKHVWKYRGKLQHLGAIYANPKLVSLAFGVDMFRDELDSSFELELDKTLGKAVRENTTLERLEITGDYSDFFARTVFANLGPTSKLESVRFNFVFPFESALYLSEVIFDAIVRGCPLTTLDWPCSGKFPRLEAALSWNKDLAAWRREAAALMFCWKHSSAAAPGAFALAHMPPELLLSEVLKKPQLESYLGEVLSSKRKNPTEGEEGAPLAKVQRT